MKRAPSLFALCLLLACGRGAGRPPAPAKSFLFGAAIAGFQVDVVSTDNPDVEHWRQLATAYKGPEATSGFSLQTYGYLKAFSQVIDRMGRDTSYPNFEKVAEGLKARPIDVGTMPPIECDALPAGHTCVQQAGLAQYTGGQWTVIKPFVAPR